MSPEDTAFLAMWELRRKKSRWAYVATYGVLGYGMPIWLAFCALCWVIYPQGNTVVSVVGYGLLNACFGIGHGVSCWDKNEARYRSLTSREAGADPAN